MTGVTRRTALTEWGLATVLCGFALGCGDSPPDSLGPVDSLPSGSISVMTRNLYVGASLDVASLAASPLTIPIVAAQLFNDVIASDFPERAVAIAQEVTQARPHVVALQEVSLIRTQSPGDAATGGTVPATDVVLDFMQVLLDALAAAGESYSVGSIVENADVEVPMIAANGLTLDDVRLTDFDAILVRDDVQISESAAVTLQSALSFTVGSITIMIRRGYASVGATIDGRSYRFVSTHLEPADETVQVMQANELVSLFANDSVPVVLMGDFNSAAPSGASYSALLSAGYADVWLLQESFIEGLTCCQAADLRNAVSSLTQRIDLILVRNPDSPSQPLSGPSVAEVVGDDIADRTSSGLWPSDHAGVRASFAVNQ